MPSPATAALDVGSRYDAVDRSPRPIVASAPFTVVFLPFAVLAVRVAIEAPKLDLFGDQALIDIAAARALHGQQLVGVYSRYGWNHPGPAWLFLLGIGRAAGGGSPVALVVSNIVLQGVAALLVVAAGRTLGGRAGAWISAAAVLALIQTFGVVERLPNVWNPWAVVLAVLLLILLCAMVADRSRPLGPPLAAAVVCGSFLVQTHLSAGGISVGLIIVALLVRPRTRSMRRRATRCGRLLTVAAVGLAVLMWVPPVADQLVYHPGNIGRLIAYVRSDRSGSRPETALQAVANEMAAFPLGKDEPHPFHESDFLAYRHRGRLLELVTLAYIAVAAALSFAAWRRRQRSAALLAGFGGVAAVVAVASAIQTPGPLFPYLVAWTIVVPPAIWIAAALTLEGRWKSLVAVTIVSAVLLSGIDAFQAQHDPQIELAAFGGSAVWSAVRPTIEAQHGPVLLDMSDIDAVPVAALVADKLFRSGRRYKVNQAVAFAFGRGDRSTGSEPISLMFLSHRHRGEVVPGRRLLSDVAGTTIWGPAG